MSAALDFSTLSWVKHELDETFQQAATALDAYVAEPDDATQLQFCATYIHQVVGTLRMVELEAVARVGMEMEELLGRLIEDGVENRNKAYEALMQGILQLPNYLDHLLEGARHTPILLLPLLNDLRAARGEKPLGGDTFFEAKTDVFPPPPESGDLSIDAQALAKKFRGSYQVGLLAWLREPDQRDHLTTNLRILTVLQRSSSRQRSAQLWWVGSALIEAVVDERLVVDDRVKQLLGRIDREFKRLADEGESALERKPPIDLLEALLFHIACAQSGSRRVDEVKAAFGLEDMLPDEETLARARERFAGPNRELLRTVSATIKEDLARVKDILDIYDSNEARQKSDLEALPGHLQRLANTLSMVGMGVSSNLLKEHYELSREMLLADGDPEEKDLLRIASTLLYVDTSLDNMVQGRVQEEQKAEIVPSAMGDVPESRFVQVFAAVVKEALGSFEQIKEAIDGFVRSEFDLSKIEGVPQQFDVLKGGLQMVALDRAASMLDRPAAYIRNLLTSGAQPDEKQLESVADVVSAVEYFLEALDARQPFAESILDLAEGPLSTINLDTVAPKSEGAAEGLDDSLPEPDFSFDLSATGLDEAEASSKLTLQFEDEDWSVEEDEAPSVGVERTAELEEIPDLSGEFEVDPSKVITLDTRQDAPPVLNESVEISSPTDGVGAGDESAVDASLVLEDFDPGLTADEGADEAESVAMDIEEQIAVDVDGTAPGVDLENDQESWVIPADVAAVSEQNSEIGEESLAEKSFVIDVTGAPTLEGWESATGSFEETSVAPEEQQTGEFEIDPSIHDVGDETTLADETLPGLQRSELNLEKLRESRILQKIDLTIPEPTIPFLTEDFDPETLDIFLEEADEEVGNLRQALPGWSLNPADTETLIQMRRSFHTLKGSGRLAGAQLLGDFAWAYEAMLNRATEMPPDDYQPVVDLLEQGVAMTALLVNQIKTRGDTPVGVGALMEAAHALAEGRSPSVIAVAATPGVEVDASADTQTMNKPDLSAVELDSLDEAGPDPRVDAEPYRLGELYGLIPDYDPETLDIFIEEADEELAALQERIPNWISNPSNRELLQDIRRSFHTLKGSGRLVGAQILGEFAWAFEHLLNRVLDGAVSTSAGLYDLLSESLVGLTELVAQLKGGPKPTTGIQDLMEVAEKVAQGSVPGTEEDDASAASSMIQLAEGAIEEELDTLVLSSTDLPLPQPDHEDSESPPGMDVVLYEIFSQETSTHLDALREYLEENPETIEEAQANEKLYRALHTLHGSARMAQANNVAEVARKFENFVRPRWERGESLSVEFRQLLALAVDVIERILVALAKREDSTPDYQGLLAQLGELSGGDGSESFVGMTPAAPTLVMERPDFSQTAPVETVQSPAAEPARPMAKEAPPPELNMDDEPGPAQPLPQDIDEDLLEVFLEESEEILNKADETLQSWVQSPQELDPAHELQRNLHTIKGSARMTGLTPVGDLSHAMENIFSALSGGRISADQKVFDLLLKAFDRITEMLEQVRRREWPASQQRLTAEINALSLGMALEEEPQAPTAQPVSPSQLDEPVRAVSPDALLPENLDQKRLDLFFQSVEDLLDNVESTIQRWAMHPQNTVLATDAQKMLGVLTAKAKDAGLTHFAELGDALNGLVNMAVDGHTPASRYLFDTINMGMTRLRDQYESAHKRQPVEPAREVMATLKAFVARVEGDSVAKSEEQSSGANGGRQDAAPPVTVAPEPEESAEDRRSSTRLQHDTIRVRADLIDNLVNFAGEISIYRSRMEQHNSVFRFNLEEMDRTVERLREQLRKLEIETEAQILYRFEKEQDEREDFDPLEFDRFSTLQQLSRALVESVHDLISISELLDNLTRESETLLLQQSRVNTELQEGLMRSRMVQFGSIMPRLRRIVRQTSRELNKRAELRVRGADVELDSALVERVIPALEHLLRNAVAHGIEEEAVRKKLGKKETGEVLIDLSREGGDVLIHILDDGRGIDVDTIRRKAIKKGLMAADSKISDNDVMQFILESGLSTAGEVTQVSGRGVGMDVVVTETKQLGGSLSIESTRGEGTTFVLRLPFTLAINKAMLVRLGEDYFAVPLAAVDGITRLTPQELKPLVDGTNDRLVYGNKEYRFRDLGKLMGIESAQLPEVGRLPVLLARTGEDYSAFQIDAIIGSREIVVKSLGPQISTVKGILGATLLADGKVVLILDVNALVRREMAATAALAREFDDTLSAEIQKPSVMVVDDSITIRKVTSRLLERNGLQALTAKDGVDALALLEEQIPDVMLLDIEMPRMDGYELASHIRRDDRFKHLPIIMITSRTGDKHRQRAMEIGVNEYLGKPYQESDLIDRIRGFIAAR